MLDCLLSLDFIYMPSTDPATDMVEFESTLGAEIVFAIEAFGTRVAMVRLGDGPPLLFAGHLEGERPVLVFRVESLDAAESELRAQGAAVSERFGFPHGSAVEVVTEGRHRVAVYELLRPGADERLAGRRDF